MLQLFDGATSFNQDISNWNVSSVIHMGSMFNGVTSFNQDISNWNVSSVSDMSDMFDGATSFNQDISNWDVSSATNMRDMFKDAKAFCQNLTKWGSKLNSKLVKNIMFSNTGEDCTSSVTFIPPNWYTQCDTIELTQNPENSNLKTIIQAAIGGGGSEVDLSNINTAYITNMSELFKDNTDFKGDISCWNVSRVTTMESMFEWSDSV